MIPEFTAHIGPHKNRELELMLTGHKPFATFTSEPGMTPDDVGDAAFKPYVERGDILMFVRRYSIGGDGNGPRAEFEQRQYCLPGEEWRAKLSALISEMCMDGRAHKLFTPDDLHRLDGTLLGYPKESIEAFIQRSRTIRKARTKSD
ncbi:hemin receptor [Rhizobium sp. CFBP 8762]|uniref:hemin receptor n=1 Tax=Rhizobium sp. CFBP 8762 TaxID=2775279 RepID=UPI00177C4093|nr:hemin receptor [Rhizobium sp. CFBP 8762]MBD8555622.1 hemin receptor [Rhizobium sp. CFBP 8762]